jgi:nucleotide-binding universal stress UspA family protein
MLRRILLPLDGSPLAERALPYAIRLASAARAGLILVHVLDAGKPPDIDVYAFVRVLRESGRFRALAGPRPLEVSAVAREASPEMVADEICATGESYGADLIVMSTHGRGGLGRWLYGSVADQVLRRAKVPVLLISAACDHAWPDHGPLRVLVPLDGSELAETVLGPIGELASALPSELVLVGATGPLDYAYGDGIAFARPGLEEELEKVLVYLEAVAERLRADGHSVEIAAEMGGPGSVVDAVAHEGKVDLIAMTTHGRSGLARLTLGSVATETLQRTTIPLLLTRPSADAAWKGVSGEGAQDHAGAT